MKNRLLTIVLLCLTCGLSGCYAVMDEWDYFAMGIRNDFRACCAWHRVNDCYDGIDHRWNFREGFKQGYRDHIEGGGGGDICGYDDFCNPTLPPRKYMGYRYQSAVGHQKVNAWFEGYANGVLASSQDGYYHYGTSPILGFDNYGAHQQATHDVRIYEEGEADLVPAPEPFAEPVPAPSAGYDSIEEPMIEKPKTGSSLQHLKNPSPPNPLSPPVPVPDLEEVPSPDVENSEPIPAPPPFPMEESPLSEPELPEFAPPERSIDDLREADRALNVPQAGGQNWWDASPFRQTGYRR